VSELENRFSYHAPSDEKIVKHSQVRATLQAVAEGFEEFLPDSREKSLALTKLEEAMFWANASIARY
jgi:hypothetical protein